MLKLSLQINSISLSQNLTDITTWIYRLTASECRHAIIPVFFLLLILVEAPARLKSAKNEKEIFD